MNNTPITNTKPQRVHFIGICGVAMSAVASALWNKGYKVTGSDSGFFPPVSTNLTSLGIPYYPGFHPEKMIDPAMGGVPDFVVVGNAIGTKNPELLYVQEHNIPFKSFPEVVGEHLVKSHSIVCTGTYGKTTSSALLSHILKHAGLKPSFLIGGVTQDGTPSAALDTGNWSVVEGDEYTTAKWDSRAKFMHYKPTHLMMSAVKWDHADVYPTEESYFNAFRTLIQLVPTDPEKGLILACIDTETLPKLLAQSGRPYVSYGKGSEATYRYENVTESKDGITFDIVYHGKTYNITSPLLGSYNAENITGCFAMAREIGVTPGDITDAVKSFYGMKRRLEKRYEHEITVIDEHAHSPEKAKNALRTLRKAYTGTVISIYEPNSGNRTPQSKPEYADAFKDADIVIIPRLTKLKVDPTNPEKTFEGDELAQTIALTHPHVVYMEDDEKLIQFITLDRKPGDVIAFMGPHGFRGMIEETVKRIAGK